jgi:hypothetical protein
VQAARATALDHAADELQALLADLRSLQLEEQAARELSTALESFRSFGADRWVSATAQLLVAARALGGALKAEPVRRPAKRKSPSKPRPEPTPKPKPKPKSKAKAKPKAKSKAKAKAKPKRARGPR